MVAQASNIAAEDNNLEEREIKRSPGVFWKNNIGVSQQVKAMEAKAVTYFQLNWKSYNAVIPSTYPNYGAICDIFIYL